MTEQVNQTIVEISTLVDTLNDQCSLLNKEELKDEMITIKQSIRKLEGKLASILPEIKLLTGGLNGKTGDKTDRLKARAARFGCENDEVKKITDSEKLNKRKERFNIESSSGDGLDDAKKRRLARFGGQ